MNNSLKSLPALTDIAEGRLAANLEWWYGYAFLRGSSGRRYALVAAFFRVGELPVVKGHYLIHSLIRLDEGSFEPRSYLDRTLAYQMTGFYLPLYFVLKPGDRKTWNQYASLLKGKVPEPHLPVARASVSANPPKLRYGESELSFADGDAGFDLRISDRETQVDLRFRPAKPVAPIDEHGSLNGLRYYSVTRNRVTGRLRTSGAVETLQGEGWFDRQWGQNYDLLRGHGWDWFGLQLEDGRELIVNRLRRGHSARPDTPVAKLIAADGSVATSHRVAMEPLGTWQSSASGFRYPVEWGIFLPAFFLDLRVTALLPHQEIPIVGPLRAIWEGACAVFGDSRAPNGRRIPIRGQGFAELVGYADQPRADGSGSGSAAIPRQPLRP